MKKFIVNLNLLTDVKNNQLYSPLLKLPPPHLTPTNQLPRKSLILRTGQSPAEATVQNGSRMRMRMRRQQLVRACVVTGSETT